MASRSQLGFSELIAPLTPKDISDLWRNRELRLQRGKNDNHFAALLDWNDLWTLIENKVLSPDRFRVTFGRNLVPPFFYTDQGQFNPARLAQVFNQGSSAIFPKLDNHLPSVSAVCRDAASHGIHIHEAAAIVTTGKGGALGTHYDVPDIIILQVEGTKRWRVYGPRVLKPVKKSAEKPPLTPPLLDTVLTSGDMLFLPAGYWHICDNGPGRSVHVGLFINPPTDGAAAD